LEEPGSTGHTDILPGLSAEHTQLFGLLWHLSR
jgi:hypothetical protein